MTRCLFLAFCTLLFAFPPSHGLAQEPPQMPPARVATAALTRGTVSPTSVFIGTVTYPRVSDVAAETNGRVARVLFEEGNRLPMGKALVILDAAVLKKEIGALEASRAQAETEAEKIEREAQRYLTLYQDKTVSLQEYEDRKFSAEALRLRVVSLQAQRDALREQLAKKTVYAPFAGIVIDRPVEPGEWVEPGTTIAVLALDSEVDILVNVPEQILPHLPAGEPVSFTTAAGESQGRVETTIPRGDIKTRTFPVKIRSGNDLGLLEGMEARVTLPTGPRRQSLLVPRDAVISKMGQDAVVVVDQGAARTVFVEVIGYQGLSAGISGDDLAEGGQVIVKGNERVQDGQAVQILAEKP